MCRVGWVAIPYVPVTASRSEEREPWLRAHDRRQLISPAEPATWLKGAQPNRRLGTPDDIAGLSVFLSSPAADYITGQVIASDGGYTTTANWPFGP